MDNLQLLDNSFLYCKNTNEFSMQDFLRFRDEDTSREVIIKDYNLSALMEEFKKNALSFNEQLIKISKENFYRLIEQHYKKNNFFYELFPDEVNKKISIYLNKILVNACVEYEDFLADRIYYSNRLQQCRNDDLCYQALQQKYDAILKCKHLLPFFGEPIGILEFYLFKKSVLNNTDLFNKYTGSLGLGMWAQYQSEQPKFKNKNEILIEKIKKTDYGVYLDINNTVWLPWGTKSLNSFKGNVVIPIISEANKINLEEKYKLDLQLNFH